MPTRKRLKPGETPKWRRGAATEEEIAERRKMNSRRAYRTELARDGRFEALARYDERCAAEDEAKFQEFIAQGAPDNGFSRFLRSPEARAAERLNKPLIDIE